MAVRALCAQGWTFEPGSARSAPPFESAMVETDQRPRTRGDCAGGLRPCPWVGCRYHLASDYRPASRDVTIRRRIVGERGCSDAHAADLVLQMAQTCALDVADDGPVTLDVTGQLFELTRERVRQLEEKAILKLRRGLSRFGIDRSALEQPWLPQGSQLEAEAPGSMDGVSAAVRRAPVAIEAAREAHDARTPHVAGTPPSAHRERNELAAQVRRAQYRIEERTDEMAKKRAEWAAEAMKRLPEAVEAALAGDVKPGEFRKKLEEAGIEGLPKGTGVYSWLASERHRRAIAQRREAGEYDRMLKTKPRTEPTSPDESVAVAEPAPQPPPVSESIAVTPADPFAQLVKKWFEPERKPAAVPREGYLVLPDGSVWCADDAAAAELSQRMRAA